jgi:hypothetical protein
MTSWILVIWIAYGNASSSQFPVRIAEYGTQAECGAAAQEWMKVQNRGREAACLPGPKQ